MKPLLNAPRGADVDLWQFDLRLSDGDEALLDEHERRRADRFVFERDRIHFISAHAAMRRLLGAYLGIAPAQCSFDVSPDGKPALAGAPKLRFNLAHSGGRAVLAIGSDAEVGVDIEEPLALGDPAALAADVASEAEAGALGALPPAELPTAFLRLWTRKEAALKAYGTGLFSDPRAVHVGFAAGTTYAQCPSSGRRAAVRSVEIEGCSAAVARLGDLGAVTIRSACT